MAECNKSSCNEETRDVSFSRREVGWNKTSPLRTYAAVVAGPPTSTEKKVVEAVTTTKAASQKGKAACHNVTKKMIGIKSKRGVTYNLTRKQIGCKHQLKKTKVSPKAKVTKVIDSNLQLSSSSESSQPSHISIASSSPGSMQAGRPPVIIKKSESSVQTQVVTPPVLIKKCTTPTESSVPTQEVDEIVQWLLEPEAPQILTIASPTPSSLCTLNKKIESIEPCKTLPAGDNIFVQDWLDRYVCPQTTSTEPKIVQATKSRNKEKNTAVCPICLHPVPRLTQHLQRKCMSDAKGYTTEHRKAKIAEVTKRQIKSHASVVKTSELLKAYEENTKVQYINYLINLFDSIGIVTVRDHVFTDTLPLSTAVSTPFPGLPSTASSEPSLADGMNISLDINLDTNSMQHYPITSTTTRPVAPQPPQPKIELTPSTPLAIFNPPEIEPSTPAAIVNSIKVELTPVLPAAIVMSSIRHQTPATPVESKPAPATIATPSITPSTPLEYPSVPAAASTCNDALQSPIPLRHRSPIVLLGKMPVKRKLEDDLYETTPAKKAKSISPSSDSTVCISGIRYTNPINVQMSRLGFYAKFELAEAPILQDFDTHLKNTLFITATMYRTQVVANVNRVLYNLHPAFINPDVLANTESIRNYFSSLPTALASSSKANYIKSLNLFLGYCSQTSGVRERYAKLIESMPFIKDCLASIRCGCAKRTSRKMAERRAAQFRGEETTYPITDILKCVNVLKNNYINLLDATRITHLQLKSLNTYFNAVITLKNAQRPSVFANMQLHEFNKPVRTVTSTGAVRMNVGVVEHKTASTQLATVSFTETEYQEITKYIENIRPKVAKVNSPTTVFLNRKGLKIFNPTQDLSTRQKELGLPSINSTDARHSFETSSSTLLKPDERSALASYLAHSLSTANANYVDINTEKIQAMSSAITLLQEPDRALEQPEEPCTTAPSAPSTASGNYPTIATSSSSNSPFPSMEGRSPTQVQDPIQATTSSNSSVYYPKLLNHFTINVEDDIPSKWDIKVAAENTFGCSNFDDRDVRRVRSRFDYLRNQKRSIQTVSYFPGIRPSSHELLSHLKKKGWYTKDTYTMVEKQWIPFQSPLDMQRLQNSLLSKIDRQKWHSCTINDGVIVSKRHITKGEIVCDYHADVLTHEKGLELYDNCKDNTYRQNMYFCTYLDKKYCFDGNQPCSCHNMSSNHLKGRHIKHTIDSANLTLKLYYLDNRPHLIFEAIHMISQGRILQFDNSASIETKIIS